MRPEIVALSKQMGGFSYHYRNMLDDEFMFSAGMQVPQVATFFDLVGDKPLSFRDQELAFPDLLALIAYRYGLEKIRLMGHGGYAIVFGHAPGSKILYNEETRRVLRLVPEHHVRNVLPQTYPPNEYDVELDANFEPIRHPYYPLLISDLFLLPRHTTKLVFHWESGNVAQASGYPAMLHCQLLPEVRVFRNEGLDRRMAKEAGETLEIALATLGVSVADAHGGNGGVMVGQDGQPLIYRGNAPDGAVREQYIPVVLDYGYYSLIGAKTLAAILVRYEVSVQMVRSCLSRKKLATIVDDPDKPPVERIANFIARSDLPRYVFGRLLYQIQPPRLNPHIWISHAEAQWETAKERTYPALQQQARLKNFYPAYDEVVFPQRIETYPFTV